MILTFKVGEDKVDAWVIREGMPMPQPGHTIKVKNRIYRVIDIHWEDQLSIDAYLDYVLQG